MGSTASQDVDQAVVDGLWSHDPLVRLLARQVKSSNARVVELEVDNAVLTSQVAGLAERVKRLQGRLDGARREAKRQAAPFSKGTKTKNPKPPGRKPGKAYGTKARRKQPAPDRVDEHVEVPAPEGCPDCGSDVIIEDVRQQYQEEIVPARTASAASTSRWDAAPTASGGCVAAIPTRALMRSAQPGSCLVRSPGPPPPGCTSGWAWRCQRPPRSCRA